MNVLVVDDDAVILGLFRDALAGAQGVDVACERSGYRALATAEDRPFDLAFVDLLMPGIDGVSTIRQLREVCPGSRIVIITGRLAPSLVEKARDAGADACLHKPFGPIQIRAEVRSAQSRHQPEQ